MLTWEDTSVCVVSLIVRQQIVVGSQVGKETVDNICSISGWKSKPSKWQWTTGIQGVYSTTGY